MKTPCKFCDQGESIYWKTLSLSICWLKCGEMTLWILVALQHFGIAIMVSNTALIAQVHFTYSISSSPMCTVGVLRMHHWLGFLRASLCKYYPLILSSIQPECLFYRVFQVGPDLPVWQPMVYCFSVPPANKLYVKLLWHELWLRLTIMDGFTDELITGRQSSLTTEKMYPLFLFIL